MVDLRLLSSSGPALVCFNPGEEEGEDVVTLHKGSTLTVKLIHVYCTNMYYPRVPVSPVLTMKTGRVAKTVYVRTYVTIV